MVACSMGKGRHLTRFAAIAALAVMAAGAAQAQFFDDRFPFERRGGWGGFAPPAPIPQQQQRAPVDYSHAPSPRKYEKNDPADVSTVMVLGDSMADWLAFGLETAFADAPELAVMRKHRTHSSLIFTPGTRSRSFDWVANAKELLAKENPQFIVVMLGVADRETIREPRQPAAAPAAAPKAQQRGKPAAGGDQAKTDHANTEAKPDANGKPPADAAAEEQAADDTPDPQRTGSGSHEFKSERWVELYSQRIDELIAALKSKGVPVFWVGLPPIRGTRSTSDVLFLNDLYRSRAEKAGITYVDVWDGFVDEGGRFAQQGPDFEGQTRRLRTSDGVHFTQAGARKLAHYVEKEIRRAMTPTGPIAVPLPVDPDAEAAKSATVAPDKSMPRPLAGPVIPLNAAGEVRDAGELAGASGPKQSLNDAVASRILVQGDALPVPAGRADDTAWPRRAPAPVDGDPVVARTNLPMTPMQAERPKVAEAAPPPSQVRRVRTPRPAATVAQRDQRRYQTQSSSPFFFFFNR